MLIGKVGTLKNALFDGFVAAKRRFPTITM